MKDQLSRGALQVRGREREHAIRLRDLDPLTTRSRHRDDLARRDECETVESVGVVDTSDAHDSAHVVVSDRGRYELHRYVAGLARLAGAEHLRRLFLTADPKQLDAAREKDHQPTSDGEQQQRLRAHGLARLRPLAFGPCADCCFVWLASLRWQRAAIPMCNRPTRWLSDHRPQPDHSLRPPSRRPWHSRLRESVAERSTCPPTRAGPS